MTVSVTLTQEVFSGATSTAIGTDFATTATGNPAYLVVTVLDRNEYTAAATGATGGFSGNNNTLALSNNGGDGRGCGIVYTWQASTHQYTNATYGPLSQLTYTASGSLYDLTDISLFGTGNATIAQQDASNPFVLMQADPAGYIGTVSIVTDPNFVGASAANAAANATPDGVAATAMGFVGDAWNDNGCWILASTIAAEAGAALPVQSTAVGVPGVTNGEWIVLYNGPVSASSTWQSMVSTGDVICFGTPGGGGHITTCVSGTGTTAMLVDNITYMNAHGKISNPANDGSPNDIIVATPHLATQEWSGVSANAVVIYGLDTPDISTLAGTLNLSTGSSEILSKLFTAADPAHRTITKYQVYETNAADTLTLSGVAQTSGQSAASPITATSLAALQVQAATNGTDTLDVRAYNGAYWGDWQSTTVTVTTLQPSPPVLAAQTANQTWKQGATVNLVLASTVFTDPQKQALTLSATGAGGASLPSWLSFNATTRAFTGTVPAGLESFGITVTATDTSGLSTSESFTVTVPASAPVIATRAPAASWAEGGAVNYTMPAQSFSDPQGESLTCKATLANGAALPAWLNFSATTLSFTGTAPATAQTLVLKVTATDTSGLSVSESITATISKALAAGDWTGGFVEQASLLGPIAASADPVKPVDPGPSWPIFMPHHGV
jgi:hypothetical protein